MEVEYLSLHGYGKITASDTDVHEEHQLRADRSAWQLGKNIYNHAKLKIKP